MENLTLVKKTKTKPTKYRSETKLELNHNGKVGRPPMIVDLKEVTRLSAEGFSIRHIASILQVSHATLYKNDEFVSAVEKGRSVRAKPILKVNYTMAKNGDSKAIDREFKISGVYDDNIEHQTNVQVNVDNRNVDVEGKSPDDLMGMLEDAD